MVFLILGVGGIWILFIGDGVWLHKLNLTGNIDWIDNFNL
jgi:hypothetical protein